MIYSVERNFCFIHIPRTGGTSVVRAYDKNALVSDVILGGTPFGEELSNLYRNRYNLHKHSGVSPIVRAVGLEKFKKFFSFSIIRNPLDRMISLYFWAKNMPDSASNLVPIAKKAGTFHRFCIEAKELLHSQFNHISYQNEIMIKEMILFENFPAKIREIGKKLGIDWTVADKKLNKSQRKDIKVEEETKELIKNIYSNDYMLIEKIKRLEVSKPG
jgi:hypothetical protein